MNLIIALTVFFSAAMGGTVYASNDAMPGDALYGVKQTVETIRLTESPNDPALQLEIANARLSETEKLLDAGRKDDAQTSLNDFVSAAGKARDLLQQTNTVPNASVIKEVEKQKTTIQIIESQLGGSSIEVQKAKIVVKSIETEIEIEIEIEIEHGIEIEHEDRLKTPRAVKTEDGSKTPEATQTEDKTKTPKPSSTNDNKIKTPEPTKLGEDKVKTVEPAKVETKVTEVKPAETRKPESTPKPAETKKADDKKSNSGSNSGKK